MNQQRLFRISPDAITISASFEHGAGWRVTFWSHARGVHETDSPSSRYDRLSTAELLQVVEDELSHRLLLT